MKKQIKTSTLWGLLVLLLEVASLQVNAQDAGTQCHFTFVGTLANQKVTMCFYPDRNDGYVYGHYYYGDGKGGSLSFVGTAQLQESGSFLQTLEERNANGTVTGRFNGKLYNGIMIGIWSSPDGKRHYKYDLSIQK